MQNKESQQALLNRLRRIEGQLRGVQTMVSEERDCTEILQQLHAINAALQSATMQLVEGYLGDCLLQPDPVDPAERQKRYQNLLQLLKRAV